MTRGQAIARWWRRHHTNALIVAVVAAVLGGVAPVVATGLWDGAGDDHPRKCPESKSACDGKNGQNYGCGVGAKTHTRVRKNAVRLQVRYSERCSTVWGRIIRGEVGDKVTVAVSGGHAEEAVIATNHDVFTKMAAVDPDDFAVRVCAVPSTSPERSATWKEYCIPATDRSVWK